MRSIVLRFDDPQSLARALSEGDHELPLPAGETARDGEWVLAVFEIADARGATAAAARCCHPGSHGAVLTFERRDWDRLLGFAQRPGSEASPALAAQESGGLPPDRPTQPSLGVKDARGGAPASSEPSSSGRAGQSSQRAMSSTNSSGARRAGRGEPASQVTATSTRVLLVDDERDIREVVGAMLDAVGLAVEAATSAEDALVRLRASRYDLVVLDWNLPGMTGIELCRLIRRDSILGALPVLFLTAHAAPQDVVEAFASGADDYVVKPFRAPELGARVFGLLRRARMAAGPKA